MDAAGARDALDDALGEKDAYVFQYKDWERGLDGITSGAYHYLESRACVKNDIDDYFSLLRGSKLTLCPAGDVWEGGCVVQALEFGSIPVVEDAPDFKGCADPAAFFAADAPVFAVASWDDFPLQVAAWRAAGLLDDDALDARRTALTAWWTGAKKGLAATVERLATTDAAPGDDATCARVPLSDDDAARYAATLADYYDQDHWWDTFQDSPWLPSMLCSKLEATVTDRAACFSEACSPPLVRDFACAPAAPPR